MQNIYSARDASPWSFPSEREIRAYLISSKFIQLQRFMQTDSNCHWSLITPDTSRITAIAVRLGVMYLFQYECDYSMITIIIKSYSSL